MLVIQSKQLDYNTNIRDTEINFTTDHDHDKYITTQEFNKLASENVTARLKQANLHDFFYTYINIYRYSTIVIA